MIRRKELARMVVAEFQAHIQFSKEVLIRVVIQRHKEGRKHIRKGFKFLFCVSFNDFQILLFPLVRMALVCRIGNCNGAHGNPIAPDLPA